MPITSNFLLIPCLSEQKLQSGKALLPQSVFTMHTPDILSSMPLTDALHMLTSCTSLYSMRTGSKHGHLIYTVMQPCFQSVMHTVH